MVFSACSLVAAGAVVCWVTGVLPAGGSDRSKNRPPPTTSPATADGNLSVYFSPNGGCTEAIVHEIDAATQSVYVQAAQFTSTPIAKALVAAKGRGVDVRVVIDRRKDDDEKSEAGRLVEGGVPTFTDGQHHTAHNKVIIVDHRVLFTGSFNFTRESEAMNAENLLRIEGQPKLVAAYEANFKAHLAHSAAYKN